MMTLTVAEAFAAYEAARPRLPAAVDGKPLPRQIDSLADIADDFDVFLLDAFGVLNIGDRPIAGTPARVRDLQAAGKRVLVVSNAASVRAPDLLRKYDRLGYAFDEHDVVTSRMTAIAGLAGSADMLWGVMGLSGGAMDDFGALRWLPLEDDPEDYRRAEGFLLVGSGDWTQARHDLMQDALATRPRPLWIANPDIVAPRENGFSTEPGHFGHDLAAKTGVDAVFFGKPFANIYDLVFDRLGAVDRSRVVMVGDSLHTDILGAQVAGISSVLISGFGFLAGHDAGAAIAQSGIVPDYIAKRP